MSATIYKKSGNDNCLVLQARTGAWRKFNFGNWTEIRLGMFHTGVASSSGYVSRSVGETMVRNAATDNFVFGLKSDTPDLHGTEGTNFIGVASNQTHYVTDDRYCWAGFQNNGKSPCTYYGTTGSFGDELNNANANFNYYHSDREDGSYNGFKGLKITILNSGSVSQSIQIATNHTLYSAPYTIAALSASLVSSTYTDFVTMSWNDGTSSYPIPDCIYIWNPYYNNGIRISAWDVLKIS